MGIFDGLTVRQDTAFMGGITTGVVKENWDEEHAGMVKVDIFLGENGKNITGWIPVMTSYGGKDYGMYTLPEVGSEVVIAFNMGDRNCPIVLGSLWNKKNTIPADTAVEKNTIKRFRTKGGHDITFSEEEGKAKLTVTTPNKLTIECDDEQKTISLSDVDGKNKLVVNSKDGNIEIKADKKITLNVGGSDVITVSSDGGGKVDIKAGAVSVNASQKLELKGNNTKVNGAMIDIDGSSQVKVNSSGVTTINGSMVKIN